MKELVAALDDAGSSLELELGGRELRLSSLDKVYWPRTGHTKRDLIRYYLRVAPVLLGHIRYRPLTLGRYPEGVEGPNWFQTNCPHPPPWLQTHRVSNDAVGAVTRNYCVVDDLAGLLWAVNLGSVELHPLLSRAQSPGEPNALVFDLDPGAPATVVECCDVALELRDALAEVGLPSFAKTSGGLGLHVLVPLARGHDYAQTKSFARYTARALADRRPETVTALPQRAQRGGKVFVDWSQNDRNKSTVAAYSLRALPWPAASTPLSWEEVGVVAAERSVEALPLGADATLTRLESAGDLFAGMLEPDQSLP
ncbi:MAG: non-homologous end-joining DNA ligase [Actinomycetota bacterium]|nr:non-homologous end-joining DNA ligase [Actinomycetota bacterium]